MSWVGGTKVVRLSAPKLRGSHRSVGTRRGRATGGPVGGDDSRARFPDSLFKQLNLANAPPPAFFDRGPGQGPSSFSPSNPSPIASGMARQVAQPLSISARAPPRDRGSASRRATQTRLAPSGLICRGLPYGTGRVFRWPRTLTAIRQPAPLAGGSYWPPGGAPVPPGCVLCVSTRAGAASGPTIRRL
jgi:hypothetical protein